jgi:predicted small integral membrane protein
MEVSFSAWFFAPGIFFGLIAIALVAIPHSMQSAEDGQPNPQAAKRLLRLTALLTGLLSAALLALAVVLGWVSTAD